MALVVKNPSVNAGDIRDSGSIPGSGRPLEEGMATHSSYFCLEDPKDKGKEPGRLQSMGSQGVRYNWSNLASMHKKSKK